MRLVRFLFVAAAAMGLLLVASDGWTVGSSTPRLSGAGYIDFRSKPRFKVGDWVKYRFTSASDDGRTEDYQMTILISGEERFWGDDCFWIETWAGGKTLVPQNTCILMSYSIFGDTAWLPHIQVYQRKSAMRGEEGVLLQELVRRTLSSKPTTEIKPAVTILTDTLGTDTTSIALGTYRCTKVGRKAGIGTVQDKGDSTLRFENWDRRTLYLSTKVPVTSLVKEIDERWVTRKAWKVGKSDEAITSNVQRGTGTFELIAFGSGDLTPKLTPMYARKALANRLPPPSKKPIKQSG